MRTEPDQGLLRPTGRRTSSSAAEPGRLLHEDPSCGKQGGSRTAPTWQTALARRHDLGHEAAQEAARVRLFDAGDFFWGSRRDDLAAGVTALGSQVYYVVRG